MYKKLRQIWPLALSATIGFILAVALFIPKVYSSNQNFRMMMNERLIVLNQIINYIDGYYLDDFDWGKIWDGAFHGLMEELDPHSSYISLEDQEKFIELFKGNFEGIGIEFDILDGFITVISPVPGSPSDIVGLMPGDKIIEIDDEDAYKITKAEVFEKLKGKKGTKVTVKIARIGYSKPFYVTIKRDEIPLHSVSATTMIDEITGYIHLSRFVAKTEEEVIEAIDTLLSHGMQRLIFDLRGNGGGLLEQAVAISDQFITTPDTIVYTKGKVKESNKIFIGNPNKGNNNFSLIVLINRGSASASEIVSGAIQDLDRGLVIGETSFGKGLVQTQKPLVTGAVIRLTTARYYTPSGRLIQRPYEDGSDLAYYGELYAVDRESKIDSLKQLRPKYKTRSGRTVYGGGGITPDIYLPFKNSLNSETNKVLRSPKRPFFNFASHYSSNHQNKFNSFTEFKNNWNVTPTILDSFLVHLSQDSINFIQDSLLKDSAYIQNRLKSELARSIWGKNESTNIRLQFDNQVVGALKHFNEADAFIKSID